MEALSRSQCWNFPNNVIKGQNRQWRDLIILKIPGVNKKNIDEYVINNIPELAYQFRWEVMSDNQRLQEKFKYRGTLRSLRSNGHYESFQGDDE